jgi:hypothetical protein
LGLFNEAAVVVVLLADRHTNGFPILVEKKQTVWKRMLLGFLAYSVSCVSLPPRNSRLTLNKNSTTCHEQTIGVDYFKSRKEHRLIRKVEEQVFYSREIGGSGAFLISREIGSAFYSRKLRAQFIPGNWGAIFIPGISGAQFIPGN